MLTDDATGRAFDECAVCRCSRYGSAEPSADGLDNAVLLYHDPDMAQGQHHHHLFVCSLLEMHLRAYRV